MIKKEMIGYAILMILMVAGMAGLVERGEPKKLEQKIVQTSQSIDVARGWASTFAGISTTKDFTNLNMETVKEKGIMKYDVVGTGDTSYIELPFDDTIRLSLRATTTGKSFIVSIKHSSNSSMDTTQLQIYENKVNADNEKTADSIQGYTSSGADGELEFTFSN